MGSPFRTASTSRSAEAPIEFDRPQRSSRDADHSLRAAVGEALGSVAITGLGLVMAAGITFLGAGSANATIQDGRPATGSRAIPAHDPQFTLSEVNVVPPDSEDAQMSVSDEAPVAGTSGSDGTGVGPDEGSLERFGIESFRNAAPPNTAPRVAIDNALANESVERRSAVLDVQAAQSLAHALSMQDAYRVAALADTSKATQREQARLAEEKRKAEEALRAAEAARLTAEAAAEAAAQAAAEAAARGEEVPDLPAVAVPASPSLPDLPGVTPKISAKSATTPLPAGSYVFGSRWGAVGSWSRYHTGQDLAAPIGTQVRSAADGIVMTPNAGPWAGIHVVVQHADGSSTLYAHLNSRSVRTGQLVKAGQPLGIVGMTGRTFGPHLHFEHYPAGKPTSDPYVTDDPYVWMRQLGVRL